jgi:hypothetical protein
MGLRRLSMSSWVQLRYVSTVHITPLFPVLANRRMGAEVSLTPLFVFGVLSADAR